MKTSSHSAAAAIVPRRALGSGERLRADLGLLAEAALQLLESRRTAFVVCDASLRVIAASESTREMMGADASTSLPAPVEDAVRAQIACGIERQRAPTVVRLSGHGASLAVGTQPVRGLFPAEFAVTLQEVRAAPVAALGCLPGTLGLSARERQLVDLVRRGLSNRDIAATLDLTEGTVKVYLHRLFEKLEVDSRTRLVARVEALLSKRPPGSGPWEW